MSAPASADKKNKRKVILVLNTIFPRNKKCPSLHILDCICFKYVGTMSWVLLVKVYNISSHFLVTKIGSGSATLTYVLTVLTYLITVIEEG